MVIISRYSLRYNQETKAWTVISMESPVCPYCLVTIASRDSRLRIGIKSTGEKAWYRIRRLICPSCGKTHTELPDFLHPYKHYETEAVQDEIDEVTPSVCAADESTIRIWRRQWRQAQLWICDALTSLRTRFAQQVVLLKEKGDIMARIRSSIGGRWLAFVIGQLIGGGFPVYTKFAFSP
jgi:hypothetical protein